MTATPEELNELRQAADRWAWSAEALVNAANAAEDAAELLSHPATAEAYDTARAPSPSAEATAVELRGLAARIGAVANACRTRHELLTDRIARQTTQEDTTP